MNMERTKDVLYYIGDFLACVLILSLMYFLISWKLGDSLPVSYETGKARAEATRQAEESKVVIESKGPKDAKAGDKKTGAAVKTEDEKKDGEQKAGDKSGETAGGTAAGSTVTATNKDDKKAEGKDEKKAEAGGAAETITVESGMSAVDIAYMLEEKGLVDSADLFVAKLESLDLTSSIQIGDFEIKKGMSYEEVAAVLTGN